MLTKMKPIEATRRGSERRNMRPARGPASATLKLTKGFAERTS